LLRLQAEGNDMKKFLLTVLLSVVLMPLSAQGNLTDLDFRIFRLGFLLGTNTMDFKIDHSEMVQDGKVYYADVSNLVPGFTVGLITDLRLHRYLSLRFTPSLLLGERNLSFRTFNPASATFSDSVHTVNIFSLPIELPLLLRYNAERYGNFKPYIEAGFGAYFDLGRDDLREVTLNLSDVFFTAGAGCDIYFRYFKLSPEIRVNFGLTNVMTPKLPTPENTTSLIYSNALSGLFSRILMFTLNFE
jgi:hypothetical protein